MVDFLACIFAILAVVANSVIHSFLSKSLFGDKGMLVWTWLVNSFIIECICQFCMLCGSWGIGFIILFVWVIGGDGCWAISLLGGICRIIGKWSEFRLNSTNVVDVYIIKFWSFMKKPSIKLVCI